MSQYGTIADLYTHGAPERTFGQLTTDQKNAALVAASAEVDTYLRARYDLPLVSWDTSITQATCRIAAYNLLAVRGVNPANGSDDSAFVRYNASIEWLVKVQKQQAHPEVSSATSTGTKDQPVVISSSVVDLWTGRTGKNRGW